MFTYAPYQYDPHPYIGIFSQTINGNTVEMVSARELHEFLGNGDMFANWIKHRVEKYGFVENQDFISFLVATKKPNGGHSCRVLPSPTLYRNIL